MAGKIYTGILVDRFRRVTGGLINDEQGNFRAGKGYIDYIFTLYVGFVDLEKEHDRVNKGIMSYIFIRC